ncbi:MAG: hypothetical protein ISS31_08595 [Kiritimatiellae bacterium]|nr:hypothetical protein [Kiritimatiellia bacterium]
MMVPFAGNNYDARVWVPADGCIGNAISLDTETTVEANSAAIPEYVVGSVFDGAQVWFVQRQHIRAFMDIHAECRVAMHTAAFDVAVISACCGFGFTTMVEGGLVLDVGILYRLLGCAETGDIPHRYNLDIMSQELLGGSIDKTSGIRTDFGRFIQNGVVDYGAMPQEHLEYAAVDAIATYELARILVPRCRALVDSSSGIAGNGKDGRNGTSASWGLLGHDVQLRGDIALRTIERNGLRVDQDAVARLDDNLAEKAESARSVLEQHGYRPGVSGNRQAYEDIVGEIEQNRRIQLTRTAKTGLITQKAEELESIRDEPFVNAFLVYQRLTKLRSTYLRHFRVDSGIINPHYNLITRTGRTSCSSPNVQNQPREGNIRECIVPRAGHVFVDVDYSVLELAALSQVAYYRYGHSAMRDLINQGIDLHRYVASRVIGKAEDAITGEERRKAKAINFGLPGGMGPRGLQAYAASSYGVTLTLDEATAWREEWLRIFPEMVEHLGSESNPARLAAVLDEHEFPESLTGIDPEIASMILIRIAGGARATSNGREFSAEEMDWAWQQIQESRAGRIRKYADAIACRQGSAELQRAIVPGFTVGIHTGRLRANCTFTESRNWPFQALSADGAKLALYDLIRADYRVVAFVHDEALVEVPETDDYRPVAETISNIMITAMQRVCPDVAIRTEYAVMRRWSKDAKPTYDDTGHLIAYEDLIVEAPMDGAEELNND